MLVVKLLRGRPALQCKYLKSEDYLLRPSWLGTGISYLYSNQNINNLRACILSPGCWWLGRIQCKKSASFCLQTPFLQAIVSRTAVFTAPALDWGLRAEMGENASWAQSVDFYLRRLTFVGELGSPDVLSSSIVTCPLFSQEKISRQFLWSNNWQCLENVLLMQSIFNPLSLYKIDREIDRGGDREYISAPSLPS